MTVATPALIFTDSAAMKVGELIREEDNPDLKLRVYVAGGGCSGFQYGFTFDETEEDGDTIVNLKVETTNQDGTTVVSGYACARIDA